MRGVVEVEHVPWSFGIGVAIRHGRHLESRFDEPDNRRVVVRAVIDEMLFRVRGNDDEGNTYAQTIELGVGVAGFEHGGLVVRCARRWWHDVIVEAAVLIVGQEKRRFVPLRTFRERFAAWRLSQASDSPK